MKIVTLILQKFRGINRVEIELEAKIDRKIITLIGLNESGKTTILEGLSYFPS